MVRIIFAVSFLFCTAAAGQSAFKKALISYETFEYSIALHYLKIAYRKDSIQNRLATLRLIADCYDKLKVYPEAEKWYGLLCAERGASAQDRYRFGNMLKMNGRYENAITQFRVCQQLSAEFSVITEIRSCEEAIASNAQGQGWVTRNEHRLNSPDNEFGAMGFRDGWLLSTDRQLSHADPVYKWSGLSFVKIVKLGPDSNGMTRISKIEIPSEQLPVHMGSISLTKNQDTIYYTGSVDSSVIKPMRGQSRKTIATIHNGIYFIRSEGQTWSHPVAIPFNNSRYYNVQHPALNHQGNLLVFASDQPGGRGGLDLYMSIKTADNQWSEPRNLGAMVNTQADEVFPVFDKSDHLYFSSNRLSGMGGLDLYETQLTDSVWKPVTTMMPPFNSPADDFLLVWNDDHTQAMLSSNREGGIGGDDIYSIIPRPKKILHIAFEIPHSNHFIRGRLTMEIEDMSSGKIAVYPLSKGDSVLMELSSGKRYRILCLQNDRVKYPINEPVEPDYQNEEPVFRRYAIPGVILRGRVTDKLTGAAIKNVSVKLIRREDSVYQQIIYADPSGRFEMPMVPESWYLLKIFSQNNSDTQTYDIMVPSVKQDTVLVLKAVLQTTKPVEPKKGEKFVFRNMYFAYSSTVLSDSSETDINRMVIYLKEHPGVSVEISAHTDSRGSDSYNQKLSENRAISVVQTLVKKGIDPKRLNGKGYGESQLLNGCKDGVSCAETLHSINRRIEMKIIRVIGSSIQ